MKLCDAFAMFRKSFLSERIKNEIDDVGIVVKESEMIVINRSIKEVQFQTSMLSLIIVVE